MPIRADTQDGRRRSLKTEILFGPPGTGKTTELLNRLEWEIAQGIDPKEIAYVSFTREGTNQGKERALKQFDYCKNELPYFRTLHSLAFKELNVRKAQVMDFAKYKYFSTKLGMHFTGYYTEEFRNDDDKFLFLADLERNNAKAVEPFLESVDVQKLKFVAGQYKAYKKQFAYIDFTDMIERFVARDESVPVRVAFVDEAQDLTTLQWRMVFTAFKDVERMYIAGDDDQAIYQWSGADVDKFLSLEGARTILRHSHRLPDPILNYAKRISNCISNRVVKDYDGLGDTGEVIQCNTIEEVPINPNETYMFLTRNNTFLSDIENYVMKKKVMYRRKGVSSVGDNDVRAIKEYEKVRRTMQMDNVTEAFLRPFLREGYSLTDPWYDSFDWSQEKALYFRDLVSRKVNTKDIKINISTIHAVKGGEADNVILCTDITRNVAANLRNNPDSEHRVFYVGATRAKKRLYVIKCNSAFGYKIY
jgi:superfamily I DNA/RNA helicase